MHGAQDTAGADDVVNTAGNIGHVGEVLEGGVIRSNAADANEEMLDPGLEQIHNFGRHLANLIILFREFG